MTTALYTARAAIDAYRRGGTTTALATLVRGIPTARMVVGTARRVADVVKAHDVPRGQVCSIYEPPSIFLGRELGPLVFDTEAIQALIEEGLVQEARADREEAMRKRLHTEFVRLEEEVCKYKTQVARLRDQVRAKIEEVEAMSRTTALYQRSVFYTAFQICEGLREMLYVVAEACAP